MKFKAIPTGFDAYLWHICAQGDKLFTLLLANQLLRLEMSKKKFSIICMLSSTFLFISSCQPRESDCILEKFEGLLGHVLL